jgi:hypothetical protein
MILDGAIRDGRPAPGTTVKPGTKVGGLSGGHQGRWSGVIPHTKQAEPGESDGGWAMGYQLINTLGLTMTLHNPVWGPFALDKLRELQHALMKHAFSLEGEARQKILSGVQTVEVAVTLRLRYEEAAQAEALLLQERTLKATAPQTALVKPVLHRMGAA